MFLEEYFALPNLLQLPMKFAAQRHPVAWIGVISRFEFSVKNKGKAHSFDLSLRLGGGVWSLAEVLFERGRV